MSLTKAQFKEVLDAVYNNGNYYEVYGGDTLNGIRLYVNEVEGKEYRYFVRYENNNEYFVAIMPEKNWIYTDGSDRGVYTCNVINDDIVVSNQSTIYARGAGAVTDIKTYIRNICVFLGLKMSKNFDSENPQIYQDLVDICHKYFTTGRAPYYTGKYVRNGTDTYKTYVQADVIREIATYLNLIGVFGGVGSNPYQIVRYTQPNDITKGYSLNEIYEFCDANYFKEKVDALINITLNNGEITTGDVLELCLLQFSEINLNNLLIASAVKQSGGVLSQERIVLTLYEIDSRAKTQGLLDGGTSSSRYAYDLDEDVPFYTYEFIYLLDGTVVHNKTVTQTAHGVWNNINKTYYVTNILSNIVKPYFRDDAGIFPEKYPELGLNVEYNVKLVPSKYCLNILNIYLPSIKNLLINNVEFDDKTYITISEESNHFYLYTVENVSSLKIASIYSGGGGYLTRSGLSYLKLDNNIYIWYNWYNYSSYTTISNNNYYFVFNTGVTIKKYLLDTANNTVTLDSTISGNELRFPNNAKIYGNNMGEYVEFKKPNTFDGLEKIEGSTFPTSVVDSSSFVAFCNSVGYGLNPIRNPFYDEDELQNNTYLAQWVECTIYKNPPATQQDVADNDIDNMPDDEFDKLIKDTDPTVDPDGSDEDSNGGEPDGGDPTKIVDADLVPNGLVGCLKQYKLNASQNIAFATGLQSLDFSDVVQALIYGNPVNGVISYATTYDGLWNSENATEQQITLWKNSLDDGSNPCMGYRVTKSCKEIDCGTIDFSTNSEIQDMMQDNYTDITDCYLQIMLPFVGLVDLNIRDFYNNKLHLIARVDSLTGAIVYNLFNSFDGEEYLVTSVSGNCQAQLPLKSSDMSQLIRNIGNSALAVGGSIAGGLL